MLLPRSPAPVSFPVPSDHYSVLRMMGFGFYLWERVCDICLPVSGLFCWTWWLSIPLNFLKMIGPYSAQLNSILWYVCIWYVFIWYVCMCILYMCVYGTHACVYMEHMFVYMMCVYGICICVYVCCFLYIFISWAIGQFFFLTTLILTVQNSAMVSLWCADFISLGYSLKSNKSWIIW